MELVGYSVTTSEAMTAMTIFLIILAALAVCVLAVIRKLAGPTVSECNPEWFNEFSVARYRPMLRLLDDADCRFLESQPGITPATIRRLRAERRQIFRSYLRSLIRDFHRLHMAARMVLVYSTDDRSDLAATLMRQRVYFMFGVLSIEARLLLHTVGIGTVDVRNLIGSLEAMRLNVSNFAAVPQSAA